MADEFATTSISLEKPLWQLGKIRAKRDNRSFSSLAAKLVKADLVACGWLTEDDKLTDAGRAALQQTPAPEAA